MVVELSDDDIIAILNHKPGGRIPIRYYPNEMFHPDPQDAWDQWENERHDQNWFHTVKHWSILTAYVRRRIKLCGKRRTDPSYCNKSARNYAKVITRRKSSYAKCRYDGDLFDQVKHFSS